MLSSNDNWAAALEAVDRFPIYLVTITTAIGTTHRFVTADRNLFDATMGLATVESADPTELDPITYDITIGAWDLVFVDNYGEEESRIRALGVAVVLLGKRVRIQFGEITLVEADYLDCGDNFIIDKILPGPGVIRISVLDAKGFEIEGLLPPFRWPGPPLDVARGIIEAVSPVDAMDASQFDEKQYTDISHFVVCRQWWSDRMLALWPWLTPEEDHAGIPAKEAVKSLLGLCGCFAVPGEAGTYRVKKYDRAAAAVKTFGVQEIADFEQIEPIAPVNDIRTIGRTFDKQEFTRYAAEDAASKIAHSYPDDGSMTPRTYDRTLPDKGPHPWLNSCVRVANNQTTPLNASSTALRLFFPRYFGFAGTQIEDVGGTEVDPPTVQAQQPEHQLNGTTRVGYILLVKAADAAGPVLTEIVKTTSFAYVVAHTPAIAVVDYLAVQSPIGTRNFWALGDFTIARAELGTNARDWTHDLIFGNVFAYDITIDVWLAQQSLDRASHGIPKIRFSVPGRWHTVQLGDEVALTDQVYLAYGSSGLTSSTIFQVISKAPAFFDEQPGYRLECARIRDGAAGPLVGVDTDEPDVPSGSEMEFYYDASGAIYLDASGRPYFGPPGPMT